MSTISIPASKYVNRKYQFLFAEPCRSVNTQILYGSASSGKSVAIAQRDVLDCMNECRNFLITRAVGKTLRGSVFAERVKVINQLKLRPLFDIKESHLEITYRPRGNKMLFSGLDDVEKLKSITVLVGTLTDLRVEEATEVSEEDYDQMTLRIARGDAGVPKRRVLSFNPVMRTHWISKRFFNGQLIKYHRDDKLLILHSTHWDNQFLSKDDHDEIESKTGYMHQVYARGEWGVLGDLIFTNWETADLSGMEFDTYRYGVDFGFSVDPSVVLKVSIQPSKKTIYITDEAYGRGWTNDILAAKAKPIVGDSTTWCDSAEPKSIMELRQQGGNSIQAYPVKKGKDSVYHAIQWLQQWRFVIDKNKCPYTINEFSQYQWQKDKYGETLPQPVEKEDHCIAALRYATELDRLGSQVSISV